MLGSLIARPLMGVLSLGFIPGLLRGIPQGIGDGGEIWEPLG